VKREKLEKNKAEQTKPQELKEEDISRSTNETTKNVATVSFDTPLCQNLSITIAAGGHPLRNWSHKPVQVHRKS